MLTVDEVKWVVPNKRQWCKRHWCVMYQSTRNGTIFRVNLRAYLVWTKVEGLLFPFLIHRNPAAYGEPSPNTGDFLYYPEPKKTADWWVTQAIVGEPIITSSALPNSFGKKKPCKTRTQALGLLEKWWSSQEFKTAWDVYADITDLRIARASALGTIDKILVSRMKLKNGELMSFRQYEHLYKVRDYSAKTHLLPWI